MVDNCFTLCAAVVIFVGFAELVCAVRYALLPFFCGFDMPWLLSPFARAFVAVLGLASDCRGHPAALS